LATDAQKLQRGKNTRRALEAASTIPVERLDEHAPSRWPRLKERVRLVNLRPPYGGLEGCYDRRDTPMEREHFGEGKNLWVMTDERIGKVRHFACHPAWVLPLRDRDSQTDAIAGSADVDRALVEEAAQVLGVEPAEAVRRALQDVVRRRKLRELADWDLDESLASEDDADPERRSD
jgi:hypothetical protein